MGDALSDNKLKRGSHKYMFINTTSILPTTGKLSAKSSMSEL
ncbi:hypothetical protein HMPREF9086_2380 [Enterobacter hormaechei ATCC 49162]|nr:hypothetical protein HMPREF9086_2380 [Enterobacter hormaechei ATCC 49162]